MSFSWRKTHQWQCVDKAKNVQITVSQLLTKAGWWHSPLALQSFSRNIASTPNYINSNLGLLSLPSLVFNKNFTISEWASKYMFCTPRTRTLISALESCRVNYYATDVWIVWLSYNNILLILNSWSVTHTTQKIHFMLRISSVNVNNFLRIWSHLLKKPWMENFIFSEVLTFHFPEPIQDTFCP